MATGYTAGVLVIVAILVVLALIFGVGAVLEGLAWLFLFVVVLIALAAWLLWRTLRGVGRSRT